MKIKLNGVFFGCFFLMAFLAEIYFLLRPEADLFTIGSLGIVVLISLYLLIDSIRNQWRQSKEKTLFYLENMYREEVERGNVRYTEQMNLQKASYTAGKKNAANLEDKLEELMLRLQAMEKSNTEALRKVEELQKRLMEGQKNALNIEVNYQKDNTKTLIAAIREEAERLHSEDKLDLILEAIKELKELPLQVDRGSISRKQYIEDSFTEEGTESENMLSEVETWEQPEEIETESESWEEIGSYASEAETESVLEAILQETLLGMEQEDQLPEDEIGEEPVVMLAEAENPGEQEAILPVVETWEEQEAILPEVETWEELDAILSEAETRKEPEAMLPEGETWEVPGVKQSEVDTWEEQSMEEAPEVTPSMEELTEEKLTEGQWTEEEDRTEEEELKAEQEQMEEPVTEAMMETSEPKVVPLYDDPYKSLTTEEIAAMFASYGK